MTEEHWNACTDAMAMLAYLRDSRIASDRKLRLFACACCRMAWEAIPLGDFRSAVLTAERYSDGLADAQELESARSATEHNIRYGIGRQPYPDPAGNYSHFAPAYAAANAATFGDDSALRAARGAVEELERGDGGRDNFRRCDALRDIIGNPFRPPCSIAEGVLAWNGGLVVNLAQAAYEQRSLPSGHLDNARLAVLSDALEDAGCTDAELLKHLREPSVHVRGCFAVDSVLGRH